MKNENIWLYLTLPEGQVPVTLTRRVRKSVGIRIQHGTVELIAHPAIQEAQLQEILRKRQAWIAKHVLSQREQQYVQRQGEAEAQRQLTWQGQKMPLYCCPGPRLKASMTEQGLCLEGVRADEAVLIKRLVRHYLRFEAKPIFIQRLAQLAQLGSRQPTALQFSSARTRWGSCTAAGVIRLNWRLIQAPPAILDYVIAHELAHLTHMNHSAAFWAETARLYPDWQAARRWLKQHGASLFHFD